MDGAKWDPLLKITAEKAKKAFFSGAVSFSCQCHHPHLSIEKDWILQNMQNTKTCSRCIISYGIISIAITLVPEAETRGICEVQAVVRIPEQRIVLEVDAQRIPALLLLIVTLCFVMLACNHILERRQYMC